MRLLLPAAALMLAALCGTAAAQDEKPEPIPFAGGQLTVTQTEEYGEKTLAFDGKELAHNYFVNFDRIARVEGVDVALFDVGDGGNACGPAKVMVWKTETGAIEHTSIGENDCGAPVMAVNDDALYFVPWLMPGGSAPAKKWSPSQGFSLAGTLTYTPEPGTGWKDVDPSKLTSMIDAFRNEAVYQASRKLLGDRMEEVVTGLAVSGAPETTKLGWIFGNGCTPHACGLADSFMAVDAGNKAVYFAHQGEKGIDGWPALKHWPAGVRSLMKNALRAPD